MNYASIDEWCDWHRSYNPLGNVGIFDAASTSTAESFLSDISDISVEWLKSQTAEGLVAETANAVWWYGQSLKKFRLGCVASQDETVRSFAQRDAEAAGHIVPVRHIARMKELLSRSLEHFGATIENANGRFGPGSVAERCDAFQKWEHAPDFSFDFRTVSLLRGGAWSKMGPARLCCVPKTFSKLRLISVEPLENSFGQQYVREAMLDAIHAGPLRGTVMDQSDVQYDFGRMRLGLSPWHGGQAERLQRELCIKASRNAKRATLDLSDASDSIGWRQVLDVFPPLVCAYLERFRTERYTHKALGEEPREMCMYAGMGNATTFVVETLFFWAAVTSVCEWLGDNTPVTVFGDDIICGNRAANHPLFEPELQKFGLKINRGKSGTSQAPGFRESCGTCAVAGHVLPELIRINGFDLERPEGRHDACQFVNRLAHVASDAPGLTTTYLIIADQIGADLIGSGVPNLGSWICDDDAEAVSLPWYPPSSDLLLRFGYQTAPSGEQISREPSHCSYQRLEAKLRVRRAKQSLLYRNHLSLSEAIGVIGGQLATSHKFGQKKSCVKIPVRGSSSFVRRWVPLHR